MEKTAHTKAKRRSILGIELPSLKEGSFASNITFISGRNAISLVTQLIFTPLIMHLYDPAAYGAMGAVLALSYLLLPFATLQYDRAMLLAQDEHDLQGLRALGNMIALVLATALMAVIGIGGERALAFMGLSALGNLVYLVPFILALTAWAQISQQMVFARMRYKQSFIFGSLNAVGNKLTAILYAMIWGGGALGLISAETLSRAGQLVMNRRAILKERLFAPEQVVPFRQVRAVASKYKAFPKFELPAVGLAALANQIPLWWLPKHYGLAVFGQFSVAMALLEMPMRLLGSSMSSTYYQKAARTYAQEGPHALRSVTTKLMRVLAVIGFVPFLVVALAAHPVFAWLFQDRWALAGTMISALAVYYYFRLIAEPVASVFRVLGQQRTYLFIHGSFLILRSGTMLWATAVHAELLKAITMYAAANTIGYLLQLLLIRRAIISAGTAARDAASPTPA